MVLQEEIGTSLGSMTHRKLLCVEYNQVEAIAWDHSSSSIKITTKAKVVVILDLLNSLELERELMLRFKSIQQLSIREARALPSMPPFEVRTC
jgi:hypothetical protein